MKKCMFVVLAIVIVLAFAACDNGNNPTNTTNPTSVSSSDTTGPTTSGGESETTTTTSGAGGNGGQDTYAMEQYVPVRVFSESRNENAVIYVDRDEFIRYINSHEAYTYIEYSDLVREVTQVFPLECMEAYPFDANSRAIVRFDIDLRDMEQALINEKGEFVYGTDGNYYNIIPAGDNYLAFYSSGLDSIYATLIDKDGKELARAERMTGWPKYVDGRIVTTEGEVYDAATLVQVEARQISDLDRFTWTQPLGDGYYAVADFSQYTHNGDGEDLMDAAIQDRLFMIPSSFAKAIYKDGELLTGYEYYRILPVLPYQADVFYVEDERGAKILNVKTGKVFSEFDIHLDIGMDQCYLYPGLVLTLLNDNTVYTTVDNALFSSFVDVWEGNRFSTYYSTIKTYFYSIPEIVLDNRAVMDEINNQIRQIFMFSVDPVPLETHVTLRQGQAYGYCQVRHNVLIVTSSMVNTWIHNPQEGQRVRSFFFNLDTGRRIEMTDWFSDLDAAKERMLDIVNEAFSKKYPDLYGNVQNPEQIYQFESWGNMMTYDASGFQIRFESDSFDLNGDDSFTVLLPREEMVEFLVPEYKNVWGDGSY